MQRAAFFLGLLCATVLFFEVGRWSVGIPVSSWTSYLPVHTGKYSNTLQLELGRATNSRVGPTVGQNAAAERYMIYYCQHFCGGWADRLKGIVIAYVIATLTNRTFGIQILDNPCSLTEFLLPNGVNWVIPEHVDLKSGAQVYGKLQNRRFYNSTAVSDFEDIFTARVALFKANLDYFDNIKTNQLYQKQLQWMLPLTRDQIFARIYKKLFKYSPSVQRAVDLALKAARPAKDIQLICGHLRFARNSELLKDTSRRHTMEHGDTLLAFLKRFDPKSRTYNAAEAGQLVSADSTPVASSKMRFFVTADSDVFINKAAKVFGRRFVRTNGTFVHVDRPGTNRQAACDGFTKVLVDNYLLSTCDVLVISKSGFGRQAAYLRGTDRGLYCMLLNGTVVKCPVSGLKEMYNVRG